MRSIAAVCLIATSVVFAGRPAAPREGTGLHYRIRIWMKGEPAAVESRFLLAPTPVLVTRNHVQKPRLGGWRLEMDHAPQARMAPALVLARAEGLLYLAGPSPQTVEKNFAVRYGSRKCAVWQVQIPAGLAAHAFLAEVAPGLLALSYLSVIPRGGDVASIEIQLEGFELPAHMAPAEDGMALLRTLQTWAAAPARSSTGTGGDAEAVVSL